MDRRGFLGALVGLAAAPLLLKIPRGFALSPAGLIVPEAPGYVLTTLPRATLLVGLQLCGMGEVSRMGTVNIGRPDGGCILRINYNLCGDIVKWRPPYHEGIICHKEAPLVIDISAGTDLSLQYYDLNDNELHYLEYNGLGAGPWQSAEALKIDSQKRLSY